MNFIQIAGFLGKDVEKKVTPNGAVLYLFNVGAKAGKDSTIWYKCAAWGDKWDKMMAYLKKGSAVMVMGDLKVPTIYTPESGEARINMEITVDCIKFSPFPQKKEGEDNYQPKAKPAPAPAKKQPVKEENWDDEEVPF